MSNDKLAATFHGADSEVRVEDLPAGSRILAKVNRWSGAREWPIDTSAVVLELTTDGYWNAIDSDAAAPFTVPPMQDCRASITVLQVLLHGDDLTPEQDLRAAVAERLADATHFNGCTGDPCGCLIGRLQWAINAEQVTAEPDPTTAAIDVIAREVTEQMLDPMDLGDLWSDYADIGEDDWRDVVARVLDRAVTAKPDAETYKTAYTHLQGRAEAWAAENDPA